MLAFIGFTQTPAVTEQGGVGSQQNLFIQVYIFLLYLELTLASTRPRFTIATDAWIACIKIAEWKGGPLLPLVASFYWKGQVYPSGKGGKKNLLSSMVCQIDCNEGVS